MSENKVPSFLTFFDQSKIEQARPFCWDMWLKLCLEQLFYPLYTVQLPSVSLARGEVQGVHLFWPSRPPQSVASCRLSARHFLKTAILQAHLGKTTRTMMIYKGRHISSPTSMLVTLSDCGGLPMRAWEITFMMARNDIPDIGCIKGEGDDVEQLKYGAPAKLVCVGTINTLG